MIKNRVQLGEQKSYYTSVRHGNALTRHIQKRNWCPAAGDNNCLFSKDLLSLTPTLAVWSKTSAEKERVDKHHVDCWFDKIAKHSKKERKESWRVASSPFSLSPSFHPDFTSLRDSAPTLTFRGSFPVSQGRVTLNKDNCSQLPSSWGTKRHSNTCRRKWRYITWRDSENPIAGLYGVYHLFLVPYVMI